MVSHVYFQMTDNHMRFTEKIVLKFLKEIKRKKRIFVKPNIVSNELYPTTTHPDVLRYVLKNIPESCEVTVADAPAADAGNPGRIIKNHPLAKVCRQLDQKLENLHDLGFKEVRTKSGLVLNVSRAALESNYMISLPLMKRQRIKGIGIAGSLENNFSLLDERSRKLKKDDMSLAIAELNVIRKPDLFIVDMIDALTRANEIRCGGKEAHVGVMLAGKDPVALDCLGLELLKRFDSGLKRKRPEDIPSIKHAMDLKVGSNNFNKIQIKE